MLSLARGFSLFLMLTLPLAAGSAGAAAQTASESDADKLAEAVYNREDGTDATSVVDMILTTRDGSERVRRLALFALDLGESERISLMRFELPKDVEGTGLLTRDHAGDDSEQWLYLPALDRVRRISSSRKGGRFVGSEFTYEDLRDREPSMDNHRIIGTDKIGKIECTLLESIPVERSNSIYTKRVSCVHEKTLLPLRIDFFEKNPDRPTKRLSAARLKKIQGFWTVLDSTMTNLKTGSKTLLSTDKIVYDQGLPEELFSVQGLSDASRQQQYLPKAE